MINQDDVRQAHHQKHQFCAWNSSSCTTKTSLVAAQCILKITIVIMEIKQGDPLTRQGNKETRQKTYGFDIKTPHVDHSDQDVVGLDHDQL